MSRVKIVKAPPGARRLIESLRDLGYDTSSAIADLVDNSVNADASNVRVEIFSKNGSTPAHIIISDDGKGMDSDALHNAMRFGSHQEYGLDDLGKYGLGLKTASLSQCAVLTAISKPRQKTGKRARVSVKQWDIEVINKSDDWDLLTPDVSELSKWQQEVINEHLPDDGGTVVIWSDLEEAHPLLESDNSRKSESEVAAIITDASEHLRMVFHRFMEGRVKGAKKLKITVAGTPLVPWDPFCREQTTKELTSEKFNLTSTGGATKGQKEKIVVQPFVLPRQDEFDSKEAAKEASGPKNWNFQQGFYFYRNNRMIQSGGWSNLRAPDEHTKLLRIAIDFNAALDDSLGINITKMRARIPAEIREELRNFVTKWVKVAEARYRSRSGSKIKSNTTRAGRPSLTPVTTSGPKSSGVSVGQVSLIPSNVQTNSLAIAKGTKPGQIKVLVPSSHLVSEAFSASGRDGDLKKLCLALIGLVESVVTDQIDVEEIPLESFKRQLRNLL